MNDLRRPEGMTAALGEMQHAPAAKSWRRLFRFGLRGLMIFVLVVGGGLGWIVHRAQVQHDSVAAIRGAGGIGLL